MPPHSEPLFPVLDCPRSRSAWPAETRSRPPPVELAGSWQMVVPHFIAMRAGASQVGGGPLPPPPPPPPFESSGERLPGQARPATRDSAITPSAMTHPREFVGADCILLSFFRCVLAFGSGESSVTRPAPSRPRSDTGRPTPETAHVIRAPRLRRQIRHLHAALGFCIH